MESNSINQFRQQQYFDILQAAPIIKRAIATTFYQNLKMKNAEMPIDNKLYLMVIAPALVGFTEWVLDEAVRLHKSRVYFLSRDGYQMYLIANEIVKQKHLNIECKYLHVSRFSMRLPGYHFNMEKSIDSICVGGIDVTPLKILRRAALTDEECQNILNELELNKEKDIILNYQQVIQLREKIRQSKLIRMYIQRHSVDAYENTVGYLKQEGLCDNSEYLLVDSGWIGTLQCSIEALVKSMNPDIEVQGCYFGMYEYPTGSSHEKFHTYYFSPESGLVRKSCFSNSLFETIVSSLEGMTKSYDKVENGYVPVMNDARNPNADQMKKNIAALQMLLAQISFEKGKNTIDIGTIEKLFYLFMSEPSIVEVKAYGDNLFSDDVIDGNYKKTAAELTWEQIRNQRFLRRMMIVSGVRKATLYESAWLEGSIVKAEFRENKSEDTVRKTQLESLHVRIYKYFVFLRKQLKRK